MSKKEIKKQKKQRKINLWNYYNKAVFYSCTIIGSFIAFYVGIWVMFLHTVWITYIAFTDGKLTLLRVLESGGCILCSTTVAGAIWSFGYMLGRKLEKKPYGREFL